MGSSEFNGRNSAVFSSAREMGVGLWVMGLGLLIFPVFVGSSTALQDLAMGLRDPGWVALGLGAVVLAIDRFTKNNTRDKAKEKVARLAPPPPARETRWGPAVFAGIEWRRFEAVCEMLFGQAGFETRSQSHGADGGVDIWLHSRHAEGPVAVVQCKHWQGKAVGVKELREFLGVMTAHKMARGTYATTSIFTPGARKFAKDNGINALDGEGLLALIAQRTPEQQQALLDVAYEGEYWRPTCARCGIKLVERTRPKNGTTFWGCTYYPRCKTKLPMAAVAR